MSSSIDEKRSEPWANLLAGGVGGLACQVIGHPFDTVKVALFRNISDVVFIDHILYCHSYRFWSKLSIFDWFSQGAPSDNEANRPFWKDGLHQCHRLLLKNSNLHLTRWSLNINVCQVRHEGPMVLFRGMSALALFSVPRFALLWYYSR